MALKALIFDVDGTLAETEELHRRAFNDAFEEFALEWHWSADLYRELLKTTGGKERTKAYAAQSGFEISDEALAEIHAWKTARYGDLIAQGALALRPGIVDLIDAGRRAGLKIAIATTTNLPNVEALSRACFGREMNTVFDSVAAGDMVAHKKPAPDVYELALSQLGFDAGECIAFEDTLNGVKSAKGAGLRVVLSQSAYSKGEDEGAADFVIGSFEEALSLEALENLGG